MANNKDSIEDLMKALFYEAGIRTGKPDSKNAMANNISEWLMDHRRFTVSARTLVRQYDRYVSKSPDAQENAAPSSELLNEYAIYLEYENYADFVFRSNDHSGDEKTGTAQLPNESSSELSYTQTNSQTTVQGNLNKFENDGDVIYKEGDKVTLEDEKSKKRSKLILIIVIFIAIITSITLLYFHNKSSEKLCLFWKETHFEQMACESGSQDESDLVISTDEWQDTYKNFRKIEPNENTRFFDSNGKAVVWYQQKSGEYEFFNQPGTHPLNGNKLLPVNGDVVETYLESIESPVTISDVDEPNTPPETIDEDLTLTSQPEETEESTVKQGKYCFKNESDKSLTTYLYGNGQLMEKMTLQPSEQTCIYLAVNEYRYSSEIKAQPGTVIASGKIMVRENREGSINLTLPKEKVATTEDKESTIPETKPEKDCSKGDLCVKNTTNRTLTFRLKNKLSPSRYTTLTIHPGKTECFYDIPADVYGVDYNFGTLTVTNMEHTNVRVVGCETIEKVF